MSSTEKATTTTTPETRSPLYRLAVTLSGVSAVWTAYSSWDLLDRHPMAFVAGATYDILWMSLVYTEWKNRTTGKNSSPFAGWAMLIPVAVLLTWHGYNAWGVAGAIAGPFLAIGTKVLWHKAIEDSIDEIAIRKSKAAKEIDLLNAETDIILEKAEAEIRKEDAESEAEHKRILAEKERAHEIAMADLRYESEEKQAAVENKGELLVSQIESASFQRIFDLLEQRNAPQTINGEIVAQPERPALNSTPIPASRGRKSIVTAKIPPSQNLTEAQESRKRLAALYYIAEDEALLRGENLSMAAFADKIGSTRLQVSRSCREFSRQNIGDIEVYREEAEKSA